MISIDRVLNWLGQQEPAELKARLATPEGVGPELKEQAELYQEFGDRECRVDSQEAADAATLGAQDQDLAASVWKRLTEPERAKLAEQVQLHSEQLDRDDLDSLLT
jgi:hypothetical protein